MRVGARDDGIPDEADDHAGQHGQHTQEEEQADDVLDVVHIGQAAIGENAV